MYIHIGNITRSDYELEFYYDERLSPKDFTLYFHWSLSKNAEALMTNRFIIGFHIIIECQLDYGNNLTTHLVKSKNLTLNETMENEDLTLNITLEPNQWYLLIGKILTADSDTWGPEAVYKYFKTPGNSLL